MARGISPMMDCIGHVFGNRLAGCLLILLLAHPPIGSVLASGTVTNCTEGDLRVALRGGGTVILTCDTIIPLTSPIIVEKPIVLDGTGHSAGISGGAATNLGSLFQVQPGASLTLRNLTVTGAILNLAADTTGQDGQPAQGGAIFNDHGTVYLDGCTLSDHRVTGGAGSGAVSNGHDGGNGGGALGAAIYNLGGQITVTNTTFSGNTALGAQGGHGGTGNSNGNGGDGGAGAGAAIYNASGGALVILATTFSSNSVTGGPAGLGGVGGGILQFPGNSGNSGPGVGAGIFNESGSIRIVNSTFVGNHGVGSVGNPGTVNANRLKADNGTTGGPAEGAGLFNLAGSVTLTNCSFVDNALTGGAGGAGATNNSAGFGGDGGNGGGGGSALGAGIYNAAAAAITVIVNCTFSDNHTFGGPGGPGGAGSGVGGIGRTGNVGPASGAALFSAGGSMRIRNSILAYSALAGNAAGTISDEGFNLSSDATPQWSARSSRNSIDPLLGSFASAGGIVSTMTLASNSPAINAITAQGGNGAPPYDQRNALRAEPYDIGAYEFNGTFAVPALQAVLQTNQVVLSWPATGNFLLQTSTNLVATNSWTLSAGQSTVTNGIHVITIAPSNPAQFFRLSQPSTAP